MATKKDTPEALSASADETAKKKTKKKKAKRKTKAQIALEEEQSQWAKKWKELKEASAEKAQKYVITNNYEANTSLEHDVLGWGYVLTSKDDRLEVLFEDGIKKLIANYEV